MYVPTFFMTIGILKYITQPIIIIFNFKRDGTLVVTL